MDEPFVSLEKPLANQLRDQTISLIKKNKVTVILVTHELHIAEFASRVITLKDGLIISDKKV